MIARENELSIQSTERAVFLIADGVSNPIPEYMQHRNVLKQVIEIGQTERAVVSGIPIIAETDPFATQSLLRFFDEEIVPKELEISYTNEWGMTMKLRKGAISPATGFKDVSKAVESAFNLALF